MHTSAGTEDCAVVSLVFVGHVVGDLATIVWSRRSLRDSSTCLWDGQILSSQCDLWDGCVVLALGLVQTVIPS